MNYVAPCPARRPPALAIAAGLLATCTEGLFFLSAGRPVPPGRHASAMDDSTRPTSTLQHLLTLHQPQVPSGSKRIPRLPQVGEGARISESAKSVGGYRL